MNNSEIKNLIEELLKKVTISVNKISEGEDKPESLGNNNTAWFSIEVDEPRFFWDRGGEGLFALNHIVRRIVENKTPKKEKEELENMERNPGLEVLVDINGFQKKRIENVRAVAHMMAERARYFKSNIEIDPMPAFERRIVHEFLSDATDLKTESEGEGRARRVVIKYTGTI